ncbi:MAG: hypothetical protein WC095_01940 [Candidatus Paceibacterota bacterium]
MTAFVFIAFFLPRWAAFDSAKQGLSYRVITNSVPATIIYNGPALAPQDTCDKENVCFGLYTLILDGKDYLYLDPGNKCKLQREVGYNYDTGPDGKKIITNYIVEKETICSSITVPKERVLEIVAR